MHLLASCDVFMWNMVSFLFLLVVHLWSQREKKSSSHLIRCVNSKRLKTHSTKSRSCKSVNKVFTTSVTAVCLCVCLCVQLWGPEVYRSDPTTWTKTNEARWTHDPWTQHRQPRRAAAFLLTEIFKHWDQTWRWRMKTEGAQLQVRVQLTRRPWSHGSSVRAASLFYWSVLKTTLRLQLWFHFHPNRSERLKATRWGRLGEPDPWPPPLRWPKKSTRGLDGTCGEGGRHRQPLPPTAGSTYLSVTARRALGLRQRVEDFV